MNVIDKPAPPPPPKPKASKPAAKPAPKPAKAAPARVDVAATKFSAPAGPTRRESRSNSFAPLRAGGKRRESQSNSFKAQDGLPKTAREAIAAASDSSKTASLDDIRHATDDFKKATKKTDQLNQTQGVMVAELKAAGRTPAEIETAVTRFVGRNKSDYDKLDQTAAKLAGLEDDAARLLKNAPKNVVAVRGFNPAAMTASIAGEALKQLPALADTKTGAAMLADQVARAGQGQSTFLSDVRAGAANLKDGKQVLDDIASATVSAVASRSIDLARAGNVEGAHTLLKGLKTLEGPLFGTKGSLDPLLGKLGQFDTLRGLPKAKQAAALAEWTKGVKGDIQGVEGTLGPKVGNAFKGLGLVLGGLGTVQDFSKFDQLSFKNQLRTVSDGLGFSVEAGTTALKIFKNAESGFLEVAGKRLPVVGAVFDGIDAFNSLRSGNYVGAGASAALAIGAVLTATGIAAPVGIALMAAGGVVKLVTSLFGGGEGDEGTEHAIQQGYKDAGLPDSVATALDVLNGGKRVIGPFLTQMGGDPRAFVNRLAEAAKKDPGVIEDFRKMVQHLSRDDQGKVATQEFRPTPMGRAGLVDTDTPDHPRSMPNARAWLRAHGLG